MATTPVAPAANAAPSTPAPAMPTGAPPAPSADTFDSKLDAVFGGAESAPSTPAADTDGSDAAPPEAVTADAQAEEIIDDHAGEPAAEVQAAEPDPVDEYGDVAPDKIEGGKYYCSKTKWDRMHGADKAIRAIRDIDPTLNVDRIREMYQENLEINQMLTDYRSGDPRAVANVAEAFINNQQNPASVAAFADSVMAATARLNPQAFKAVQSKILATLAAQQFQMARSAPDPNDRAAAKALAQNLQYLAHGRFDDPDARGALPQDPLAAERAALARERQQFSYQRQQEHQARVQQAVNAAEMEANTAIDQAIESALAPIPAEVRQARAVEFRHAQRDLRDAFEEIRGKDEAYQKQRGMLLSQLRANPSDEARKALVKFDQDRAKYAIGRAQKEVLSRFSSGVMKAVQSVNAKHEAVAARKEPGAVGTATQRATLSQKLHDPNLSYDQKWALAERVWQSR